MLGCDAGCWGGGCLFLLYFFMIYKYLFYAALDGVLAGVCETLSWPNFHMFYFDKTWGLLFQQLSPECDYEESELFFFRSERLFERDEDNDRLLDKDEIDDYWEIDQYDLIVLY